MLDIKNDVVLVVSSCDKYEDAWYPYFELIKKYWPEHPRNIVLITEKKQYSVDGLNIHTYNYPSSYTWSERLYKTLEKIESKYIIFSLEDFFLLDYVKQDRIDECLCWMEENPNIAVCRLYSSDNNALIPTDKYKDFYIANRNIGYRLETQAALWNRETLMSFIDLSENPWQFEANGSERIKGTDKLFLWHHTDDVCSSDDKIFYYYLSTFGYGISWGHWLWKNKKWFEENSIFGVKFWRLGILSEKAVSRRFKHLYNNNPTLFDKMIKPFWRIIIRYKKIRTNVLMLGFKDGLKESWKQK